MTKTEIYQLAAIAYDTEIVSKNREAYEQQPTAEHNIQLMNSLINYSQLRREKKPEKWNGENVRRWALLKYSKVLYDEVLYMTLYNVAKRELKPTLDTFLELYFFPEDAI